jgi:hypothetical protein
LIAATLIAAAAPSPAGRSGIGGRRLDAELRSADAHLPQHPALVVGELDMLRGAIRQQQRQDQRRDDPHGSSILSAMSLRLSQ